MDLFDHHRQTVVAAEAPLAARMRPRNLDEFVGQSAILGEGRLLRRAIQADQLSSLIFYGPPGTGKTTLAQIIANTTQAHFIAINAVLAGVQAIRDAIATAQERRGLYQQRTILFVDEVHRFNKSQQDALLPWVENGTVILIGATTENPYFEVNKALVSRSRIFQLKTLEPDNLKQIIHQALTDPDRGYGQRSIQWEDAAIEHWVNVANGDARALLNALELAVSTTPKNDQGVIHISLAVAEESIQRRAVLYDKEGDAHFDTISAFIKSLRGSDPDAAMYWLARMVYAGEDPRFIFRRMLILAGEDVGLADPNAVVVVNACAAAFDRIGLPEGRYPLAQAALYLATCPKSNSVMGFFDALATIEREREADVPNPLRDPSRDKEGFGHGAGYLYPHAYRDHWVAQQYLPTGLQGKVFYQPSNQGHEAQIAETVARQREAQLAAMVEGGTIGVMVESIENLSTSPADPAVDRWLQRTLSQAGESLGQTRDRIFALAKPQRHHVVLDVNAGTGLLTWEAVRQVPEGGVYALPQDAATAQALLEQTQALPAVNRPIVLVPQNSLSQSLEQLPSALKFDRIIGRNYLMNAANKADVLTAIVARLAPTGRVVLAELVPRHAQRLYQLVDRAWLSTKLYNQWRKAEERIYQQTENPKVNWDEKDLKQLLEEMGFQVQIDTIVSETQTYLSPTLFDRWFSPTSQYLQYLQTELSETAIDQICQVFRDRLLHQTVPWQSHLVYLSANWKKGHDNVYS
ncbi:AAA family ATPase [Alkalinema pantanalense CENA528]|uniref:AAA family ATPase n=1 Tax=Alkalinema pantanalense TaxID=1620705 RepID=UPI003D6F459A